MWKVKYKYNLESNWQDRNVVYSNKKDAEDLFKSMSRQPMYYKDIKIVELIEKPETSEYDYTVGDTSEKVGKCWGIYSRNGVTFFATEKDARAAAIDKAKKGLKAALLQVIETAEREDPPVNFKKGNLLCL